MDSIHRSERNALAISIMDPVGQLEPRDEQKTKAEMSEKTKKEFLEKKAWEVAIAPGKQFLMTGRRRNKTSFVDSCLRLSWF